MTTDCSRCGEEITPTTEPEGVIFVRAMLRIGSVDRSGIAPICTDCWKKNVKRAPIRIAHADLEGR